MASFKKLIKNIYGTDTYQDTKNTYDWITKAVSKGGFPNVIIDAAFLFQVSEITCSCEGICEFVENAYGQSDYSLVNVRLTIRSNDVLIAFVVINSFGGIDILSTSKTMLERMVNLIENTTLDEKEQNNPCTVMYIETQINNNGINVAGDNNIVANNGSTVKTGDKQSESGFKKFLTAVWQNIASNIIWYLLTLAIGAVLAYFAMK